MASLSYVPSGHPESLEFNVTMPNDETSYYELDSLRSPTSHSQVPSNYDEAKLLEQNSLTGPTLQTNSKSSRLGKLPQLGRSFSQPNAWQYAKINKYLPTSPTSHGNVFRGWRRTVLSAAVATGLVFLINFIFTIFAAAKFGAKDGIGVLYTGDCARVERWDTGLHLVINILGTILLAASSYTMQCLSSPTRSEADAAHAKRVSLDVGILSFRNLFHVAIWKRIVWCALCLTAIPLHMLWNSTIFSTIGANEFSYFIVDETFFDGKNIPATFDQNCPTWAPNLGLQMPDFNSVYESYKAGNYSRIEVPELVQGYTAQFVTRKNIIAVTKPVQGMRLSPGCAFDQKPFNLTESYGPQIFPPTGNATIDIQYGEPLWNGSSVLAYESIPTTWMGYVSGPRWLCRGFDGFEDIPWYLECSAANALSMYQQNHTYYLRPLDDFRSADSTELAINTTEMQTYPIEYFLSEDPTDEKCTLQYATIMLGFVVACNAIQVICMTMAVYFLWDSNGSIIATVGDAVASYTQQPDSTTIDWCLLDFRELAAWKFDQIDRPGRELYIRKRKQRLFHATTKFRWWATVAACSAFLFSGMSLLGVMIAQSTQFYTIGNVWKLGLHTVNYNELFWLSSYSSGQTLPNDIVANAFQLPFSIIYFLFNSLYTAQCSALEWSSYINGTLKSLRVTWPHGQQRSTYYLQLPYEYSIPLMAIFMLLHFLTSQSVFLAQVQWYTWKGVPNEQSYISDVGYSPLGILIIVCIGAALVIAQILHSFRPLDTRMPLHGNQSVVISAMCHSGEDSNVDSENRLNRSTSPTEENIATKHVMWGAIKQPRNKNEVGHCGFTTENVEMPLQGRRYR